MEEAQPSRNSETGDSDQYYMLGVDILGVEAVLLMFYAKEDYIRIRVSQQIIFV